MRGDGWVSIVWTGVRRHRHEAQRPAGRHSACTHWQAVWLHFGAYLVVVQCSGKRGWNGDRRAQGVQAFWPIPGARACTHYLCSMAELSCLVRGCVVGDRDRHVGRQGRQAWWARLRACTPSVMQRSCAVTTGLRELSPACRGWGSAWVGGHAGQVRGPATWPACTYSLHVSSSCNLLQA